jgi:hypothetical protein
LGEFRLRNLASMGCHLNLETTSFFAASLSICELNGDTISLIIVSYILTSIDTQNIPPGIDILYRYIPKKQKLVIAVVSTTCRRRVCVVVPRFHFLFTFLFLFLSIYSRYTRVYDDVPYYIGYM